MSKEVLNFKQFINGQWLEPSNREYVEVFNPSDDSIVGKVPDGNEADAQKALEAAAAAQKEWAKVPAKKRGEIMVRFADLIMANQEEIATVLTKEQGKLFSVAKFEVEAAVNFIKYTSEWARRIEGDIIPSDNENEQIWIQKVPRGVVVAITAWNFPFALAGRKIGPALVAGNAIVVKPTAETPLSTFLLAELSIQAGIPAGLINIINGPGRTVGDYLVRNPLTNMVTMTGSTPAGQAIFKAASDNLAHVQLELGGKAPFIAFEDADIDAAVDAALNSRFDNCGQVCTCNERMYVHQDIYDEFMEKFMAQVKNYKVGDPFDPTSNMGPKVNKSELEHMHELVAKSIAEGATLAYGGKRPEGAQFEKGNWFMPTVLTNVTQDMTIVHEESFGPILPVIKFKDFDEVVKNANDCEFGLAAMVFTNDMNRIMRLNRELDFGEIYVNRPHGESVQGFHNGYKMSGTGGEDGKYGFEQYLEKKTFYVRFKG